MIQKNENTQTVLCAGFRPHRTQTTRDKNLRPCDAGAFIRSVLPDNSREHFISLHLTSAHQVIAYSITAHGGRIIATSIPARFFQTAMLAGAVAVVVGHNHPRTTRNPAGGPHLDRPFEGIGDLIGEVAGPCRRHR